VGINLPIKPCHVNLIFSLAYTSFLEWNNDPEIAAAAEHLYSNIDNLELYVGLQAEQAKPVVNGAGLCPGVFRSPLISGVGLILSS
jgi:hypothetical protein